MIRPKQDDYWVHSRFGEDKFNTLEYTTDLNDYIDEIENKLKFRNDILCYIGETLVDESKKNITTKCAIKRIRGYLDWLNEEQTKELLMKYE